MTGAHPSATSRLFVAIPLDDAVRKALRRTDWWLEQQRRFRKVPQANRHVTVAFLGDIPGGAIAEICDALDRSLRSRAAFTMACGKTIALPSARRQRVLAIELDASTGFGRLAGDVREGLLSTPARERLLTEIGGAPRPHITVARKKRTGGSGAADLDSAPPTECVVCCDKVELVRSELTSQGPIYTPLRGWSLTG